MTGLQAGLVLSLLVAGVAAVLIPYYLIEIRPRERAYRNARSVNEGSER